MADTNRPEFEPGNEYTINCGPYGIREALFKELLQTIGVRITYDIDAPGADVIPARHHFMPSAVAFKWTPQGTADEQRRQCEQYTALYRYIERGFYKTNYHGEPPNRLLSGHFQKAHIDMLEGRLLDDPQRSGSVNAVERLMRAYNEARDRHGLPATDFDRFIYSPSRQAERAAQIERRQAHHDAMLPVRLDALGRDIAAAQASFARRYPAATVSKA